MNDWRLATATSRLATALVFALFVAGCGSGVVPTVVAPSLTDTYSASLRPTVVVQTSAPTPAPTVDMQPAVDTASAFIQAIGDPALANSYMVPSKRTDDDVDEGPLPPHEIQNVQCIPSSVPLLAPNEVVVHCSFTAREDWSVFAAGGHGVYVWLSPQSDGSWLVYDCGN